MSNHELTATYTDGFEVGDTLKTEALIIGAGLSGAVAARRLREAGMDVLCLEQGSWQQPNEYPGLASDWELSSLGPWHPSPNRRRRTADYDVDDSDSELKVMMFNGVGGSTILYGGQWMRFLESDFRTFSRDGVGDDWPITYQDLAPYYDQVDVDFGVSGLRGDTQQPRDSDYPLPPLPLTACAEKVACAHHELKWHWWTGSNAIASRPYRSMRPCVQLGLCGVGCRENAKASTDVTHWPDACSNGVRLLTEARVTRLTHDEHGRVTGAIFVDQRGNRRRVLSRITLVAANAIGTPRLLLASRSALFPNGLANSSGLVGKRLMMHPFTRVFGFFDEHLETWQGAWGQSIYSLEFAETQTDAGFVRGAKWNLGPSGGPLSAALMPWDGEPLWGKHLHEHVDIALGRTAIWGIACDDLPEEHNNVALHPTRTDMAGVPIPKITYRISENSWKILNYNRARATESLKKAGAHRVLVPDLMPEFGWHPLGTCRMGEDPTNSVVNEYGESHDISNLYVIDASVFVTGSSVNPAATVAALALRTAEHIINKRVGEE